MTVDQLIEALGEYHRDLRVNVEVVGNRVDLLGLAETGGGLWLTLEVEQDQVTELISDYVEDHRGPDGNCDL